MKLGISDKGLRRIARSLQGMPFLADPPASLANTYEAIEQFPGFHTTENFDMAATYAVVRNLFYTKKKEDNSHYTTDYPVVVQLNMEDFEGITDYDAEETVKNTLIEALQTIAGDYDIRLDSDDEDIIFAAENFLEDLDLVLDPKPHDSPDPLDYISEAAFFHFKNPILEILYEPEFPNWVRTYLSTGEVDSQMLMKATKQYRYTKDVDENLIQAIWYLEPIAQEMYDKDEDEYEDEDEDEYEDEDEDEYEDALWDRWIGFNIPDIEQLYGDTYVSPSKLVYGTPQEGGQYHGTTYKGLLQAAPGLAGQLPAPPSPPYQGE